MGEPRIIRMRKGLNGWAYSVCDADGRFIGNFNLAEEIKEHYAYEIKHKLVKIVKETKLYPVDAKPSEKIGKKYGYVRISRPQQSIERQVRNIKKEYPEATVVKEVYTGTKMDRPEWNKLLKQLKSGDVIIFDSVSRMSRNADDGIKTYFELYDKGIMLIFLKEHYIDTSVYEENAKDRIELSGGDEDEIFKGLNNYFRRLAKRQIRIAFDQAEKEVEDLHQRTKEGIETARLNGKQIGQKPGTKLTTKKSIEAKEIIKKHSKDFGGSLSDIDCMRLTGLSRNTYYKYKREIKEEDKAIDEN